MGVLAFKFVDWHESHQGISDKSCFLNEEAGYV